MAFPVILNSEPTSRLPTRRHNACCAFGESGTIRGRPFFDEGTMMYPETKSTCSIQARANSSRRIPVDHSISTMAVSRVVVHFERAFL
jgi:hypothetical protein